MAENVTLASFSSLQNDNTAVASLNSNNLLIETAFADCLSLAGTTPNSMLSNLDMNGHQILNLPSPATISSPARLLDVVSNPTIQVPPVGTSGATVPLLNAANTWSALQTFNAGIDMGFQDYLNWNTTVGVNGYGLRDLNGVMQFKNSGGVWENIRNIIYVTDYGADNTGTSDSSSAIRSALAAAELINSSIVCLYFPAGIYLIASTIQISASNIFFVGELGANSVLITRKTDFGPAFQFSKPLGQISTLGFANFEIADTSAINNIAGFSSVTVSPYQVIFDGCTNIYVENVQIQSGAGQLALKGVVGGYMRNLQLINPGTSELNNNGTGLYVGFSNNTNVTQQSSGIMILNLEMEGGSPFAGKIFDGFRVDGCDGLWVSNGHVQGTTNSSLRLSHSGAFPMSNLFFDNFMCDECSGNGILLDGTQQVKQSSFRGSLSCGAGGGANKAGLSLSSTGGLSSFDFSGVITGWGGSGIILNGSNTQNVTIRSNTSGNNLSNGSNPAISIQQGTNISIVGGVAGGGDLCHPNIAIGASAIRVSLSGVLASASTTFGVTIASGATFIDITGCDLSGCTSGAISDSSGAITKSFMSNLGSVEQLQTFAFAALPSSPSVGMLAYISDSTVATWGSTIAGSSTHKVLGWYNGTNWTVFGA